MGAYIRTNGATGPRNCAQILAGPYRIPDIHVDSVMVVTNKTPIGTYRAPGRFEADFYRERLIDLAAKDLGIDRVEFRRRNLIADAEMPWQHARMDPYGGGEYDSGDYATTFERCLREFGWAEKASLQGRLIDGRYHGLGLGCFVEGGASGPRENARLAMEDDGTVSVFVGSSAVGQGLETVFAQIAADALELPMSRIRGVFHGSTGLVTDGVGSHASRSTVMGGSAIVLAAAALKDKLRAAAAQRFGCGPDDVALADGMATQGGRSLAYADFAGLSVESVFSSNKRTYAYGTHCAHVAVDPRTGAVQLLDYMAVEDVGRIINPATLHGQVIGSIVQGLGGALLEHIVYDAEGQLLTASLADYLMPTADDFPRIEAIALEEKPSPNNPLGAKGAGEGGVIPTGGVIANAVASALASFGVEPKALPLSPPRVWRLIQDAAPPRA
jgi:carbon-monoxide dehydrogenase large subunit